MAKRLSEERKFLARMFEQHYIPFWSSAGALEAAGKVLNEQDALGVSAAVTGEQFARLTAVYERMTAAYEKIKAERSK